MARRRKIKSSDLQILAVIAIAALSFAATFLFPNENSTTIDIDSNNSLEILDETSKVLGESIYKEANQEVYLVTDVVDGDTIKVAGEGEQLTIRLLGIDTPESVHPNGIIECFGKEASKKTEDLLLGKKVYLEDDDTQDNQDRYGRYLRYVLLEDKTLINALLLQNGFANEYTYRVPYKLQKEFKALEEFAKDNKLGLWGEECS